MTDDFGFGEEFMIIEPIILEIYLNKSNYKDRLLINDLRKGAQIIKMVDEDSSSFFVKAEDVEDIIYTKYRKDIQNLDSSPPSKIAFNGNSIYFIENALRSFAHLRYFRICVSDIEEIKSSKESTFDYKVMHSRIDLANNLEEDFLHFCTTAFIDIGVYQPSHIDPKPYIEVSIRELYHRLYKYASQFDEESEEFLDIYTIMDILGKKIESDDSTALIIMKK
jgi:hypothetical protein